MTVSKTDVVLLLPFLLGSIQVHGPLYAQPTVSGQTISRLVVENLILEEHSFTLAELRRQAVEFVEKNRGTVISVLTIFTSVPDRNYFFSNVDHKPYRFWVRELGHALDVFLPMAQVISTREGAVLRVAFAPRKLIREVLNGRDPLQLESGGRSYEIIHIATVRSYKGGTSLYVFVRTASVLDEAACLAVATLISSRLTVDPAEENSIAFRNDSFFYSHADYPFLNRFEVPDTIPSEEEFQGTYVVFCGPGKDGFGCGKHRGW
jgi:hypothetical protein